MVSNNSPSNETQAGGPKPISEWPSKNPNHWFVLGVVAAILLVIGMVGLAVYMLSWSSPWADRGHAMQVFQPFLVGMAGIVTLCTVVWRGLINEAQANEQRRQNDAKDMADVGLLLEKAGTFLADESPLKRGVGFAMLNTVITTPNSPYAQYAFDLVCDELAEKYAFGPHVAINEQIRSTILRAQDFGVTTGRQRKVRPPDTSDLLAPKVTFWRGFPPAHIQASRIEMNPEILEMLSERVIEYKFSETQFYASLDLMISRGRIHVDHRFESCSFSNMRIGSISFIKKALFGGGTHHFQLCDFSEAKIYDESAIGEIRMSHCSFLIGRPPVISGLTGEETVQLIQSLHPDFFMRSGERPELNQLLDWRQ